MLWGGNGVGMLGAMGQCWDAGCYGMVMGRGCWVLWGSNGVGMLGAMGWQWGRDPGCYGVAMLGAMGHCWDAGCYGAVMGCWVLWGGSGAVMGCWVLWGGSGAAVGRTARRFCAVSAAPQRRPIPTPCRFPPPHGDVPL